MTDLPEIAASLSQIIAWMQIHVPVINFRPPASEAAIANFIKKSGLRIPDDLHQMLLIIDGEEHHSAGAIGNWRLMPIAEIQTAWGWLTQLSENSAFEGRTPKPSPYIRPVWWHTGWIPIVSSDTGDYFCIDTDPAESSRQGQVLLFLQNKPVRYLIGGSITAWYKRIVQDLEAGLYNYNPEMGFNNEAFMWSALEGKHHFDDTEGKLVARK